MKKMKPVASTSTSMPKATKMNPHAIGGSGMMSIPGGMGGQKLKHTPAGHCPKLSKLD